MCVHAWTSKRKSGRLEQQPQFSTKRIQNQTKPSKRHDFMAYSESEEGQKCEQSNGFKRYNCRCRCRVVLARHWTSARVLASVHHVGDSLVPVRSCNALVPFRSRRPPPYPTCVRSEACLLVASQLVHPIHELEQEKPRSPSDGTREKAANQTPRGTPDKSFEYFATSHAR